MLEQSSYALRLVTVDTEMLAALRQVAAGQTEQSGRSSAQLSLLRKGIVVGQFFPKTGAFTFIGVLHRSVVVAFRLTPGTRTYRNFLSIILQKLSANPVFKGEDKGLFKETTASIVSAIEDRLRLLEPLIIADDSEPLDVYPQDFEVFESEIPPEARDELISFRPKESNAFIPELFAKTEVLEHLVHDRVSFRVFNWLQTTSLLTSGAFDLDLVKVYPALPKKRLLLDETGQLAARRRGVEAPVQMLRRPKLRVTRFGLLVFAEFRIAAGEEDNLDLFFHWGRYEDLAVDWVDEEVAPSELTPKGGGVYAVRKVIRPQHPGKFGVCCWVRLNDSGEKLWLGRPVIDDAQCVVTNGFTSIIPEDKGNTVLREDIDVGNLFKENFTDFDNFSRVLFELRSKSKVRDLGLQLFEWTKNNSAYRQQLSVFYQRALNIVGKTRSTSLQARCHNLLTVLDNLGLGEVVFISPEGPHAIAGGLAQVIIGLSKSLNQLGVSTTVITCIYEEAQGRKHKGAEVLLTEGVRINDKTVPIYRVGEIKVPIGPTLYSGSRLVKEFATNLTAIVYCAEHENVRIFFLRNKGLIKGLYSARNSDAQLRQSILLCRGALELLLSPQFDIKPHVLLTNDWMTGLVPAYLKTDPRYLENERLRNVHTVHVLHNCGQAYQGRFYVNQFSEDLWPMFGLADQHFFGLLDPHNPHMLNLSAAAIYHVDKALLAVSKPYAQQLMTEEGGEGLDKLIRTKAERMFGISNGVDLTALRLICWQLGENARQTLEVSPMPSHRFTEARFLKRLSTYKQAAKLVVQRANGMIEDSQSVLISFVGRLVEQKGTALLSEQLQTTGMTVLESILVGYPEVQIIIGGPPAHGDPAFEKLVPLLEDLTKRYPGRIQGMLDFIPHAEVIEITMASDLFLMPSRYEPGGIAQLEALATGTLVVARNVGGISATLIDYDETKASGSSFLFEDYTPETFYAALTRALQVLSDRKSRKKLVTNAASQQHDWSSRAPFYLAMLQYISGVWNFPPGEGYPHLATRQDLLPSICATLDCSQSEKSN